MKNPKQLCVTLLLVCAFVLPSWATPYVVSTNGGANPAENYKTVTASTNKASECEGTRGHFANPTMPQVQFQIAYEESTKTITWTLTETEGRNLTYAQIQWNADGAGNGAATSDNGNQTFKIALSGSTATYSYQVTDNYVGKPMGIFFLFEAEGGGGRSQTAQDTGFDTSGVIYYVVGECQNTESNPPCMNTINANDITPSGTSVTVDVSATDGDQPAPTKFLVSTASTFATSTEYTAAAGAITITGLTPCSDYTYYIAAKDRSGNISTDNETASCRYQSISFTTTAPDGNLAQGKTATVSYSENGERTANYAVDGKLGTRWATGSGHNNEANWIQVDLGSVQVVNSVRIYWEAAYSRNYEILFSDDGSNYHSVYHQTTDPSVGNGVNSYQNHSLATPTPTRYVKVQAADNYATDYGLSIWELEVYGDGECPIVQEEPMMISGAATDPRAEEAVIHLTSRDNKTSAADMIYHLNVRSTSRDLTDWNLRLTGEASGDYTIKGLVPGTNYTVTVYCEDEDENLSTALVNTPEHRQITFSFTTSNGGGNNCTKTWEWQDIADINDPSFTDEWPVDNYSFVLNVTPIKVGETYKIKFRFTVTTVNPEVDLTMSNTYLHIWRGGWLQQQMGSYGDTTFDVDYEESNTIWEWNADNRVGIKCELNGVACIVGPFIINPAQMIYDYIHGTGDCGAGTFVITQKGRTPVITLPDGYDGTFTSQILYYRQFSPGQWEPICLPFAVSSVEVYDPDENEMFTLTPVTTSNPNGYYLLRQQVEKVSGAAFKESWYDGTDDVPQKKTAYNIFFPMNNGWGEFYTNKYVLFRGTDGAQTVETAFSRGAAPTEDDQYTLYGNNTLSTTTLTAYFETNDGKFYEKEENRTLQPFECYVLANTTTLSRMARIAPWRGVPTDIENTWAETTFLPNAAVYNTFGQLIFTMQNTIFYDVMERCMTFPAGCYIVISELGTQKIIIP